MKIICKTTLLPFPPGTRIRIRLDDPASLTWGIFSLTLAEGHSKAVIDWGDGITVETAEAQLTHTYAQPGEYEVRISDDIAMLSCSGDTETSPFHVIYAPMIREFRTNATLLEKLGDLCFYEATNIGVFRCEGSALSVVGVSGFGNCPSLVGRVDLPGLVNIDVRAFVGCVNVTELHFRAADEEVIKSSFRWKKSVGKFGAPNATSFFDL